MKLESLCLVLLQIIVFLFGFFSISASGDEPASFLRFQLLHSHGRELLGREPTPEDRRQHVEELLHSDRVRKEISLARLGQKKSRRAMETSDKGSGGAGTDSFKVPFYSGNYARIGGYFITFNVGTPAQTFLLIADTGSELTWMNCQYRSNKTVLSGPTNRKGGRRIFLADQSNSFRPINCSSRGCTEYLPMVLPECPTPGSPCKYSYEYTGGKTTGFYAKEWATVTLSCGKRKKLKDVVIGCSQSFAGLGFEETDGMLGLGNGEHSFVASTVEEYGGTFSYCLMDNFSPRNMSNHLTFGSTPKTSNSAMTYTRLYLEIQPYYSINIKGISVDGKMLPIPRGTLEFFYEDGSENNRGPIVDSGNSITCLLEPAYVAVMEALTPPLKAFKSVKSESLDFEFCFKDTPKYNTDIVPRLAFHLEGGVQFKPPVKNYVLDVGEGVWCIGLLPASSPHSIIGNLMQQNFLWEFDLVKERLGFMPSTCESK